MKQDFSMMKHPFEMNLSSIRSVGSKNSQVKEVDSFLYHEKGSEPFHLKQSFSGQSIRNSQMDSLRYSDTPQRVESSQKNFSPLLESSMNKGCSPSSLLEELKRKQPPKDEINEFLFEHRTWVPRPPFSAVALWNPAFRRLQEIQEEIKRKAEEGKLKDSWPGLQDQELPSFYRVPDDMLEIITESTEECYKQSFIKSEQGQERIQDRSLVQISEQSEYSNSYSQLMNQSSKCKELKRLQIADHQPSENSKSRGGFQSRSFIDRINESKLEDEEERILEVQQTECGKAGANQQSEHSAKIEIEIENSIVNNSNHSSAQENANKMTFNKLRQQLVKHLQVLEDLNNSMISLKSSKNSNSNKMISISNKSNLFLNSKQLPKSIDCQIEIKTDSHYLESSGDNAPLTFDRKMEVLTIFNGEQEGGTKSMVSSMVLFKNIKNVKETQSRLGSNQNSNSYKSHQQDQHRKVLSKSLQGDIPKSKRNKNRKVCQGNFESCPFNKNQDNSAQFKKLEGLMKDFEMKESIIDSLGMNSSNNGSIQSIIEKELSGREDSIKEEQNE